MIRKIATWAGVGSLGLALSTTASNAAGGQPDRRVTLTLQSVVLTNLPYGTGYWHKAVFLVTNSGILPVHLSSCGSSFFPTNHRMPLGILGRCTVPPGTNTTMEVIWRPSTPGPHWFRYAVFEPANALWKARMTALEIGRTASGNAPPSGWLSKVWSTNGWVPAYEIISPNVPTLSEPLRPLESTLQPEMTNEPPPWPSDLVWSNDILSTSGASAPAQTLPTADQSQPFRPETNQTPPAAGSHR